MENPKSGTGNKKEKSHLDFEDKTRQDWCLQHFIKFNYINEFKPN